MHGIRQIKLTGVHLQWLALTQRNENAAQFVYRVSHLPASFTEPFSEFNQSLIDGIMRQSPCLNWVNNRLTLFLAMIGFGFALDRSVGGFLDIMRLDGRSPSDFVALVGAGPTFVNMGVSGLIATAYVVAESQQRDVGIAASTTARGPSQLLPGLTLTVKTSQRAEASTTIETSA